MCTEGALTRSTFHSHSGSRVEKHPSLIPSFLQSLSCIERHLRRHIAHKYIIFLIVYMAPLYTWLYRTHGSIVEMALSYTWLYRIHGSIVYMALSYTWLYRIHGSIVEMALSYTWLYRIHGSIVYMAPS